MKKTLPIFVLTLLFVPNAFGFVDYGTNSAGNQCYNQACGLIYSNDRTLIGGSTTLNVGASLIVAQPNAPTNAERTARQKAVRAQICLIIGC